MIIPLVLREENKLHLAVIKDFLEVYFCTISASFILNLVFAYVLKEFDIEY